MSGLNWTIFSYDEYESGHDDYGIENCASYQKQDGKKQDGRGGIDFYDGWTTFDDGFRKTHSLERILLAEGLANTRLSSNIKLENAWTSSQPCKDICLPWRISTILEGNLSCWIPNWSHSQCISYVNLKSFCKYHH